MLNISVYILPFNPQNNPMRLAFACPYVQIRKPFPLFFALPSKLQNEVGLGKAEKSDLGADPA